MSASTVSVRMYNVGFGDAFLVTVEGSSTPWRMLIDCGVHSQGQARAIRESVQAIIGDLAAVSPGGTPHLDVVAATHHHADHISGFSVDAWQDVEVDEVWLPFVEDESDADAVALRRAQTDTAGRLLGLIEQRTMGLDPDGWPADVQEAHWFALNSLGNADAADRLLGRNGQHFAGAHRVRYFPRPDEAENTVAVAGGDAVVHVVGPSRDPEQLKRMDPPKSAGWLRLDLDDPLAGTEDLTDVPLFDPDYVVGDQERLPESLTAAKHSLNLATVTNDPGLLGAASILERAVNNTSLFMVLDVGGRRLIFPGDAQEGAWQHVLQNPAKAELLRDAVFYKVGHHGSHNATPKAFVEEVWHDGGYAMLPWGLVERWRDGIPKRELLEALHGHRHTVIRADAPEAVPGQVTVNGDLWSEVFFPVDG
jgi:beta-lactamase superfamily II metal-dependent hydrolase